MYFVNLDGVTYYGPLLKQFVKGDQKLGLYQVKLRKLNSKPWVTYRNDGKIVRFEFGRH